MSKKNSEYYIHVHKSMIPTTTKNGCDLRLKEKRCTCDVKHLQLFLEVSLTL